MPADHDDTGYLLCPAVAAAAAVSTLYSRLDSVHTYVYIRNHMFTCLGVLQYFEVILMLLCLSRLRASKVEYGIFKVDSKTKTDPWTVSGCDPWAAAASSSPQVVQIETETAKAESSEELLRSEVWRLQHETAMLRDEVVHFRLLNMNIQDWVFITAPAAMCQSFPHRRK